MEQTLRFDREQLKNLRLGLGLTQKEFADRIGTTAQSVSAWERGDYLPTIDSLLDVVNTVGAKLDAFFVLTDETDKSGSRRS